MKDKIRREIDVTKVVPRWTKTRMRKEKYSFDEAAEWLTSKSTKALLMLGALTIPTNMSSIMFALFFDMVEVYDNDIIEYGSYFSNNDDFELAMALFFMGELTKHDIREMLLEAREGKHLSPSKQLHFHLLMAKHQGKAKEIEVDIQELRKVYQTGSEFVDNPLMVNQAIKN